MNGDDAASNGEFDGERLSANKAWEANQISNKINMYRGWRKYGREASLRPANKMGAYPCVSTMTAHDVDK